MKKLMIFVFILALFMLASCAGMRKDTLESDMDAAAEVGASANSYDVNTTPSLTADYLLGIDDFGEGSWAVQRFNISNLAALYWANPAFTGTPTIANGGDLRVSTTTTAHEFSIQVYDNDDTTWRDALTFANGDSPSVTLGTGVTLAGIGDMTVTGAFTSPGIDDNADDVAITIDATTEEVNFAGDIDVGAGVTVGTILAVTPQSLEVTTEANITLTSSLLLLTGDNDGDNDAIDLQDGTVTGQQLTIVGVALIDSDDTITVAMTDTTCTGCLTVLLDEIGDTWGLVWTGLTWATVSNSEVP